MRPYVIVLALVNVAAPAAAEKFDLICTTEVRYRSSAEWRPSDPIRYRIDLEANLWCRGDCSKTQTLATVNDRVIFLRSHLRSSELDGFERERIYRKTGELSIVHIGAGPIGTFQEFRGQCERAQFSGFPDAQRD
ncbi:MAG TPA: hypothetical protein VFP12_07485 [Allosphingosinicella sp.]|nr:hypothetical protein [Allosphingosinicella sp.]